MVHIVELRDGRIEVFHKRTDSTPLWLVSTDGSWEFADDSTAAFIGSRVSDSTQWRRDSAFMKTTCTLNAIRLAAERLQRRGRDFNLPRAGRTLSVDFFGAVSDAVTGERLVRHF